MIAKLILCGILSIEAFANSATKMKKDMTQEIYAEVKVTTTQEGTGEVCHP